MAGRRREKAEEKGRAGVGKSGIKEEGRVTFYFKRLGRQQPWFSVMPHFPHWTWEKRGAKREKEKEGTRDGMDFKEERTCAVQFHLFNNKLVGEWKTGSDVHMKSQHSHKSYSHADLTL